jgi:segregation and condensation protein A
MSGVTIHLNQFEGPMGLLLYLIRKEEMDIMNINIFQITGQYLSYIRNMSTLDLENAGDFVAMAATLIHIKSRMLLPDYTESEDEELSEDPRKELVQKLLDYQKYKEASQNLYERTLLNRDVWLKGGKEPLPESADDAIWVEDNALFGLISSYRKVVKRAKNAVHKVSARMQSVASRILEIRKYFVPGSWVSFFEILKNENVKPEQLRPSLLITFLSLLELGKLGLVKVFQNETYGDIHVEAMATIDGDVISQVEEYEILDADERSESLFDPKKIEINMGEIDEDEESATVVAEAQVEADSTEVLDAEGLVIIKDNSDGFFVTEDSASDADIEMEEKLLGLEEKDEDPIDLA